MFNKDLIPEGCVIWRSLGPEDMDGEGLFKDENGYFVYSCTPSVEKRNNVSEKEAKAYAKNLCSDEEFDFLFRDGKKEKFTFFVSRRGGKTSGTFIKK